MGDLENLIQDFNPVIADTYPIEDIIEVFLSSFFFSYLNYLAYNLYSSEASWK